MKTAYYKTNDPTILQALKTRNEAVEALRAKGEALAEFFGGELIVRNGISGYAISGLRFTPRKDARLWTVPDRQSMDQQRPRQKVLKATQAEKDELAALQAEWKRLFPRGEAAFEPVLNAMGTSYGNLIFGGAFAMRQTDDVVYVATSAKVNEKFIEILASEYEAAVADIEAKEKK